jgi:hypothetical protein
MTHYIVIHEESPGRFTAYPCGLPELTVTSESRDSAVEGARQKMASWLQEGKLVAVNVSVWPVPSTTPLEPDSNRERMQRQFLRILAENRRLDDEREGIWNVAAGDVAARREVIDTIRYRFEKLKDTIWDYEIPWPEGENTPEEQALKEEVDRWHQAVRRQAELDDADDLVA